MEEESFTDPRIAKIKSAIEKKLGKTADIETGVITQKSFGEITLLNRCGDVSRATNSVISGDIKTYSVQGRTPTIVYEHDGVTLEISTAFDTANHSYVVDPSGKVWDPITRSWGNLDEEEYLSRLKNKSEE